MLYSEFLEGTGCRDNEANKIAYKKAEALYMSDDSLSHEDCYRIAEELWIDNSLSQDQIEHNNLMQDTIREAEEKIQTAKANLQYWKDEIKMYQSYVKDCKEEIANYKNQIANCKACMYK